MKIPFINQDTKNRVYDVIEIGYITEGPVTRKFESKLKKLLVFFIKLLGLFPNAKKINYTC
tara:strand:+ start:36 stop:218 length:183 start_codon:yes stop_codon:yes gene_type:complete